MCRVTASFSVVCVLSYPPPSVTLNFSARYAVYILSLAILNFPFKCHEKSPLTVAQCWQMSGNNCTCAHVWFFGDCCSSCYHPCHTQAWALPPPHPKPVTQGREIASLSSPIRLLALKGQQLSLSLFCPWTRNMKSVLYMYLLSWCNFRLPEYGDSLHPFLTNFTSQSAQSSAHLGSVG